MHVNCNIYKLYNTIYITYNKIYKVLNSQLFIIIIQIKYSASRIYYIIFRNIELDIILIINLKNGLFENI